MKDSGLYKLGSRDFVYSLVTAIFVAVIASLNGAFSQVGFNVFTADWGMLLGQSLNVAFVTLIGSLAQAFMSGNNNKLLGKI